MSNFWVTYLSSWIRSRSWLTIRGCLRGFYQVSSAKRSQSKSCWGGKAGHLLGKKLWPAESSSWPQIKIKENKECSILVVWKQANQWKNILRRKKSNKLVIQWSEGVGGLPLGWEKVWIKREILINESKLLNFLFYFVPQENLAWLVNYKGMCTFLIW